MTQMNLIMRQKPTHRHREQTCGCQGGGGGERMGWELGISRCKLLYVGWINNKVLLYSIRNYIQYPVINHNGHMKRNIYMYNIYTHIYILTHIYMCIYMYNICVYMLYIYVYMCCCCIYTYIHTCVYMCMYVYMNMYMYV